MSDQATDWALKQVQEHGLEEHLFALVIIGAVCAGVGYLIGWTLGFRKARVELEKAKADARKASGENMEKLALLRQTAIRNQETVNMAMGNMRDAILDTRKSPEDLRRCRDEMCNLYQTQYFAAMTNYVEMIPTLVDRHECFHRAKTELIPGLQTMCSFLEMANKDQMLKKIPGASVFQIRREARDGFLDRVYALIPWYRFGVKRRLVAIRKQTDKHLRN